MDYGALPPEFHSARIYAGPGSGSMVAAATAWDTVAAELRSAATAYGAAIAGLVDELWQGPSATAMAAAATPYAVWLDTTAIQAEQTAVGARSAAAAYETAFASMVPPPVIAANRSQVSSLVATNTFGQNTAAIAVLEALYAQMWATDAAAMYRYAAQSAAAAAVAPFAAAPPVTGAATTTGAPNQMAKFVSALPTALQNLTTATTAPNPLQGLLPALQSLAGDPSLAQISAYLQAIPKLMLPANDTMITVIFGLAGATKAMGLAAAQPAAAEAVTAGAGPAPAAAGAVGPAASTVSAGMGRAGPVGALSVPPSWAAATPTIRLAATVLQGAGLQAAPLADGVSGLVGPLAAAGMAGSALGAAAPGAVGGAIARSGDKKPSGKQPPDKLQRVLAEMSLKPESVQHWHTDQSRLESLLAQLSNQPGVHAVHVSKKDKSGHPKSQPL